MEELLKQKEAAEKRREDLLNELEMAKILGNQEWIDQCNEELDVIEIKLEEVEDALIVAERLSATKEEIREKYPFQYAYDRLKTMSDAELLKIGCKQLNSRIDKIEELKESKKALEEKLSSLLKDEVDNNNRAKELEKEFKETHDISLMDEAKVVGSMKSQITQDKSSLEEQIKEIDAELDKLYSLKITPEYIRKEAIAELEGKYVDLTTFTVFDYIISKTPGTVDEIAEKLNDEVYSKKDFISVASFAESELCESYSELLSLDSLVVYDEATGKVTADTYTSIDDSIEKLQKLVDNDKCTGKINNCCGAAIKTLKEMKESLEKLNDSTLDEAVVEKEKKNIRMSALHASVLLSRIQVGIAFEFLNKLFDREEAKAIENKELVAAIEYYNYIDNFEYYESAVQGGTIVIEDPTTETWRSNRIDANKRYYAMLERIKTFTEIVNSRKDEIRKNSEGNELVGVVRDLSKITSSKPGEYTAEDLRKALNFRECLEEFEKMAKKEAQIEKDKIVASGELDDMLTDEDAAGYYTNPKINPTFKK